MCEMENGKLDFAKGKVNEFEGGKIETHPKKNRTQKERRLVLKMSMASVSYRKTSCRIS